MVMVRSSLVAFFKIRPVTKNSRRFVPQFSLLDTVLHLSTITRPVHFQSTEILLMIERKKFVSSARVKAALVAVAACVASPAALAAIVCNTLTTPFAIPATPDGAYINLVTGAAGTSSGSTAGWDINTYQLGVGSGAMYFYWPSTPTNSHGGTATGSVYNYIAAGATVGPASTFSVASGSGGPVNYVNINVTQTGGYLGVRFWNEATSAINYGWLQMNTTAPDGFPATITSYCYDDTGAAITAGTTPVTLQEYSID